MARRPRIAPGGYVYHVLNRAVGRMDLFRKPEDFQAFERVLHEAQRRHPLRILSYCFMSNHWHFVAWPERDSQLSEFFRWLAHTHAMRWRVSHHTVGYGHLYQGRFKSFPVEQDEHLLTLCRYVERNALTAGLVRQAQDWQWGSLWARLKGTSEQRALLSEWPIDRPRNWTQHVNTPMTRKEMAAIELSLRRSRPLGTDPWIRHIVHRLKLEHTLRAEGRPRRARK